MFRNICYNKKQNVTKLAISMGMYFLKYLKVHPDFQCLLIGNALSAKLSLLVKFWLKDSIILPKILYLLIVP